MAHIQSGLDTTLATVDPTYKALQVINKGVSDVKFNHNDFTLDAFQRLRVSEPRIVFEYSFSAVSPSSATTIWESTAVSAGTINLNTNLYGTELNTTTVAGSGYWIQSYNHIRYAPGVSTMLRFTFNLNELTTGVRSRIGMFTDQGTFPSTAGDGLYFEMDGSTASFVRRSLASGAGGVEERITQSNWNVNKMDGTGDIINPTQNTYTIDWTLAQHLVIEYQFLGVGKIRFGFELGNGVVWCHEITSVNALTTTWGRTGTLPVRAECYAASTLATVGKLTLINVTVLHEGDVSENRGWRFFGANTGATVKTVGATVGLYPLISLRAATTNDITKRARIVPNSISIAVTTASAGATSILVSLLMLPTPLTGATFAVTTGGSVVTADIAATATTAVTGVSIGTWLIPNVVGAYNFDLVNRVGNQNLVGYNAAGTVAITGSSILTLAAGAMTGAGNTSFACVATIDWKELV